MEACADWNSDYLHTSHDSNDTVDAIDATDLGGGDGANCCTANMPCALDSVEEPVIHDTTDDVYYAVDVCNRFSSLTIKHASMVAPGVEISVTLADNHSTKGF